MELLCMIGIEVTARACVQFITSRYHRMPHWPNKCFLALQTSPAQMCKNSAIFRRKFIFDIKLWKCKFGSARNFRLHKQVANCAKRQQNLHFYERLALQIVNYSAVKSFLLPSKLEFRHLPPCLKSTNKKKFSSHSRKNHFPGGKTGRNVKWKSLARFLRMYVRTRKYAIKTPFFPSNSLSCGSFSSLFLLSSEGKIE